MFFLNEIMVVNNGVIFWDNIELGHEMGNVADLIEVSPLHFAFTHSPLVFQKISDSKFIVIADYSSIEGEFVQENNGQLTLLNDGILTNISIGSYSDLNEYSVKEFELNGHKLIDAGNGNYKIVSQSYSFNPQPFRLALDRILSGSDSEDFEYTSIFEMEKYFNMHDIIINQDYETYEHELYLSANFKNKLKYLLVQASLVSGKSNIKNINLSTF